MKKYTIVVEKLTFNEKKSNFNSASRYFSVTRNIQLLFIGHTQ